MLNPYQTVLAKIKDIRDESNEVKLFTLFFLDKNFKKDFNVKSGQIVEVGIYGFGEGPFAICSSVYEKDFFQICVRKTGKLTNKMHKAKIGDIFTIRGPYGLGVFPETKRNLLLVAGGLGLVPLRSLIYKYIFGYFGGYWRLQKFNAPIVALKGGFTPKAQLFYGARSQDDLIFKDEYRRWRKYIDMHITLDNEEIGWNEHSGVITTLFRDVKIVDNPIAILCGPPIMYKFVLDELKRLKFKDEDIYMSLERRIHCAVGVCQHCAVGSKYICKDGPVFRWKDIKSIKGII
ncbi:MAG: FAD/NAD(P)-binding protein [bacterium]